MHVQVYVKAGIYHGGESLCRVVTTSKGAASDADTEWNEILEFDIPIGDIPRGAKLCFIIFAAPERYIHVHVCVGDVGGRVSGGGGGGQHNTMSSLIAEERTDARKL